MAGQLRGDGNGRVGRPGGEFVDVQRESGFIWAIDPVYIGCLC